MFLLLGLDATDSFQIFVVLQNLRDLGSSSQSFDRPNFLLDLLAEVASSRRVCAGSVASLPYEASQFFARRSCLCCVDVAVGLLGLQRGFDGLFDAFALCV